MTAPFAIQHDEHAHRFQTLVDGQRCVLVYSLAVLSDFAGRGENLAVRGPIFDASPAHGGSMGQEAAEIGTAQPDSPPGRAKSDRLPGGSGGTVMTIDHTGVPAAVGGRGIAAALVEAAFALARQRGWKVDPVCSYAAVWAQRHPDVADLLA